VKDVGNQDSGLTQFHAEGVEAALAALESRSAGLTDAEAAERLERFGPNTLPAARGRSALARLAAQFANLLILILIAAAVVTALMGHWLDTGVILAVVLLNTVIGFIQEGRAEKALDSIRHMLSASAIVRRGGRKREVGAGEVVPGDVVILAAGDRVPADLRLLEVRSLRIEEAALTGESVPVAKGVDPVGPDTPVADRSSMAWSGTMVAAGTAEGVAVATGGRTEIGRISSMLGSVEVLTTPLISQMERFAKLLSGVILAVAAAVFAFGYFFRGYELAELFMVVVALFVASIPEGLPAILTVTLAIGVQRMAERHAVIRRLPAVETLGSVSVICSDKTGTFTRNEMTVTRLESARAGAVVVEGTGYAPEGMFRTPDGAAVDPALLKEMLEVAGHCNDSGIAQDDRGDWHAVGDPMEAALIALAQKGGALDDRDRHDAIPFDSGHAFMATLHEGLILVKGAPERVLERCSAELARDGDAPLRTEHWHARIDALAAEGARVLAAAVKAVPPETRAIGFEDVEEGLVFAGLYALIDPPREEAIAAVAECRAAGIRVKMITGDHAATARAIGSQLGLEHTGTILTGAEIEAMDEDALQARVLDCDIFARTSPEHKLRLVTALQAHGLSVAMTGDGVNDAPALKRANIGIAMGRKGTEAAREAAQMVLTDDNFASISAAVREGRTVYDNLRKAILFLLPINGAESMALMAAVLAGVTLPITALQILWINMVSSIALALPLAFEQGEERSMRRPPRPLGQPLLTRLVIWRVALVATLFTAGIFGMFVLAQSRGLTLEQSRTVAVNTLVMMEVFYMFSVRYLHGGSLSWQGILGTRAVLISVGAVAVLQVFMTFTPLMNTLFGTAPLPPIWGAMIFGVGVLAFAAVEFDKWVARRRKAAQDR
jgi:magnesium-transporting ATPase (P-type)